MPDIYYFSNIDKKFLIFLLLNKQRASQHSEPTGISGKFNFDTLFEGKINMSMPDFLNDIFVLYF